MHDSQRYASMRDAYGKIYEAKGYQEGGVVGKDEGNKKPMGFPVPIIPGRMINKRTEVNIEVNPEQKKIGDVEKAYYTYPQGFDPTNREDVTRKGTTNEDVEITDDEFYNYMVEEGIVTDVDDAEKMIDHMADEWFMSLYEGLKQARKNVGMDPNKPSCWDGYKASGTKMKGGKSVPDCKKA